MATAFIIFMLIGAIGMVWALISGLYGLIQEPRIHREFSRSIISSTYDKIPKEELPFDATSGVPSLLKKGYMRYYGKGDESFYGCLKDPNHKYHKRCRELFDKYSLVLYDKGFAMCEEWRGIHPVGRIYPLRKFYLKRVIDWVIKKETGIKPKESNIGRIVGKALLIVVLSAVSIMSLSSAWPTVVDVWNGTEPFYVLLALLIMPGLSFYTLVQCIRDKV